MTKEKLSEAAFKAKEIKHNVTHCTDSESMANYLVNEILTDLKSWGLNDHFRGKQIEFWEEVQRNL